MARLVWLAIPASKQHLLKNTQNAMIAGLSYLVTFSKTSIIRSV